MVTVKPFKKIPPERERHRRGNNIIMNLGGETGCDGVNWITLYNTST
jgi:hypothetical protein